jgi:hypothetical protein
VDTTRFDDLTSWLGGRVSRRNALGAALAGLALTQTIPADAQDATPSPDEEPVFLFVQTAMTGRAEVNPAAGTPTVEGTPTPGGGASYLLTLEGHSGQTIYFSDRPDRIVGAAPTQDFLDGLGFTAENPPNAALVGEFKAGDGVVVLELITPVYDAAASTLTYGAELLEGFAGENLAPVTEAQVAERLPAEFASATLFIDDCPDITRCKRNDPVDSFFIEYKVYDVGPIPGGPYGRCWSWKTFNCDPCHYSWDEFNAFCNEGYPDQCPEWTCYAK